MRSRLPRSGDAAQLNNESRRIAAKRGGHFHPVTREVIVWRAWTAVGSQMPDSREMTMRQDQISMTLDIAGYETAMEGEDMRAVVLTLDRGQTVPWHYHSTITDSFICLKGPMVVERARRETPMY